jgi:hypothetical protein
VRQRNTHGLETPQRVEFYEKRTVDPITIKGCVEKRVSEEFTIEDKGEI